MTRKKQNSSVNHITGERNLSNNGGTMEPIITGKNSDIQLNKTEINNHGFIVGIALLVIFLMKLAVIFYTLSTVKELKEELTKSQQTYEEKLNNKVAQFIFSNQGGY